MGLSFWDSVMEVGAGAMEDLGLGDGATGGTAAAAGGSNWWEKGIEKAMPSIMGAAMKPQGVAHAPVAPGGHGVQANTSGIMKPFDEVRSMASDNPLDNIHQWSNLFG